MKNKYQIILNYIKDLSIETPDPETLISARNNMNKYIMDININSKAIKNKMIEVTTKLTYKDPTNSKKKSHFEILYSSVIKIVDEKIKKKELEKIILCDLQVDIYPKLEEIFLNILRSAGLPDIKFEKKIDFKELYNKRLN